MENNTINTIGLIVIGVILLAIVSAFIFSSSFRKDVIASEGEAAVLGLINVKGVIIVLLTGIFGALFAYILQLGPGNRPSEQKITAAIALDYLRDNRNKEKYEIKKEGNLISITHLDEDYTIGKLPDSKPDDTPADGSGTRLTATKDTNDLDKWYISYEGSKLGFVKLNLEQDRIISVNPTAIQDYFLGDTIKIGELDLRFKIESVKPSGTKYKYQIRFGEFQPPNGINWHEEIVNRDKSPDGKFILHNGFELIKHPQWKNKYYVGIGIGQPLYNIENEQDTVLNRVQMLNIIAVQSELELEL